MVLPYRVAVSYPEPHCEPRHIQSYARIHCSHMCQSLAVGGADDKWLDGIVKDTNGFKQSLTRVFVTCPACRSSTDLVCNG